MRAETEGFFDFIPSDLKKQLKAVADKAKGSLGKYVDQAKKFASSQLKRA